MPEVLGSFWILAPEVAATGPKKSGCLACGRQLSTMLFGWMVFQLPESHLERDEHRNLIDQKRGHVEICNIVGNAPVSLVRTI
jgi:hypothetical protein